MQKWNAIFLKYYFHYKIAVRRLASTSPADPATPRGPCRAVQTPGGSRMFTNDPVHQQWLESFIAEAGGIAGTVHVQAGDDLVLTAAHNIPPQVVQAVLHVARGKGMAGLAQVRGQPVRTCDLQTDDSGRIRPGARAVAAQSAIALPVFDTAGATVAVVGVAWAGAGEIDAATERRLAGRARTLAHAA